LSTRWRWYAWAVRVKEDDLKWWFRDFVRAYKSQVAGVKAGYYLSAGSSYLGGFMALSKLR